jgi:hypothetical protein
MLLADADIHCRSVERHLQCAMQFHRSSGLRK